jgi:hypothetical protein
MQLHRRARAPETRYSLSCGHRCAAGSRTVRRADSKSVKPKRPDRVHATICNRSRRRDRYDSGRANHCLPRAAKARPQNFSAKSRRIQFADASAKTAIMRGASHLCALRKPVECFCAKNLRAGTGSSAVPARIGHFHLPNEIAYSNQDWSGHELFLGTAG